MISYELWGLKNKLNGKTCFKVSFDLHFFLQDIIPLQEKT